ncbi:MAG TPA: nuclear transport factor 2 family protein [Pyrinomonadaceae bacterium]|nr:nuclear transport factor 2 family protein [Pyrinomonadaceae bacterium]
MESGESVEGLAALFSDDCEIGNLTLTKSLHGSAGAKEFWTHYQKTLGNVRSVFKNKIVDENTSALEWTTQADDGDVAYAGVSIIEHDGEKISRFFAYFDPAKLGNQLAERHHG